MRQDDFSIVIPTLNEQHYIGLLLDSIFAQNICPKEIIIVDAFSKDGTIKEIKKRQKKYPFVKYYQIPKYTIARQRNFGVKMASGCHILFLDADMVLKRQDILERYSKQVVSKKPDIAISFNMPNSRNWKDILYFVGENSLLHVIKYVWPAGTSRNMYVKKSSFKKVGGFDEHVAVGEDMDLIKRMVKKDFNFLIFPKPVFHTSARRLEKDGRAKHVLKMVKSFFYTSKNGFRNNPIEYEFGNFKPRQ